MDWRRAFFVAFWLLANVLYLRSLKGGDLGWLHDHLVPIAVQTLLSALVFSCLVLRVSLRLSGLSAGTDSAAQSGSDHGNGSYQAVPLSDHDDPEDELMPSVRAGSTLSRRTESPQSRESRDIFVFAVLLLNLTVLLSFDQGSQLDHHGSYNSLAFLLLFVPVVMGTLVFQWIRALLSPTLFRFAMTVCLAGVLHLITFRVNDGARDWSKGYADTRLQSDEQCHVKVPSTHPIDSFDGWLNVWTGSQACRRQEKLGEWHDEERRFVRLSESALACADLELRLEPRVERWPSKIKRLDKSMTFMRKIIANTRRFRVVLGKNTDKDTNKAVDMCVPIASAITQHVQLECPSQRQSGVLTRFPRLVVNNEMSDQEVFHKMDTEGDDLEHHYHSRPRRESTEQKLNVLVLYVDAISRRHFIRKMPRSFKFFEDRSRFGDADSDSEAFQFLKYHSLGRWTSLNVVPMLFGDEDRGQAPPKDPQPLSDRFKQNGYVTGFFQDFCESTASTYMKSNYRYDHEVASPFCNEHYHSLENPFGNWKGPFSVRARCMHGEKTHDLAFSMFREFWRTYDDEPKFAWLGLIEAHEGTGEVISQVDDSAVEGVLEWLQQRGDLSNTAVVLVSDHGLHMGLWYAMETTDVIAENRYALLHMLLPKGLLSDERHKNLVHNEDKLVTAWDVYATLSHLAHISADPAVEARNYERLQVL
ncbi:MAG: hypothetical protein MHM6MM_002170 [Cercozoa sp. M6MM]